ncbi:DUF6553 family protein [Oribacterium sp. WCC10]|uniref:DUF6553 family protein n=1 Tax=Oribacterium sp. WCC10 TaxID=1855343 RepID=UPI0008ED6515|nr:DUF6553 family protein [Oribacterium sp. WCC10]SFG34442.1 hypothetical protein SAMN05216356_10666 [Oribacterium sp. WCC10]
MILRNEHKDTMYYEENWPLHYYEIEDIDFREEILKKKLAEDCDNQRRLDILLKRYPKLSSGQKRKDNFIAAWMNLFITGRLGINFLNKNRIKKEVTSYLQDLCILDFPIDDLLKEEWRQFAIFWITTCINDKTYDSTIFGLIRLNDKALAMKIASDIIEITCSIPSRFNYEADCKPLYDVMKSAYIDMIEDGEKYWTEAASVTLR